MTVTRKIQIELQVEAADEVIAHAAARLSMLKALAAANIEGEHEVLGKYKVTAGNGAVTLTRKRKAKKP